MPITPPIFVILESNHITGEHNELPFIWYLILLQLTCTGFVGILCTLTFDFGGNAV